MSVLSDIRDYIPKDIWELIKNDSNISYVSEIRFRLMYPVLFTSGMQTYYLKDCHGKNVIADKNTFDYILNRLTGGSLYSVNENIKQGFVTLPGGHRVGMCGTAVCDENGIKHIKDISALCFRICREIKGCGHTVINEVTCGSKIYNTLIVSPPGCGKTTLLRDLCRILSNGEASCGIKRIGIADERSEIAATCKGVSKFDIGNACFVCDGYSKKSAMNLMLRTMSPDIIVCDEIGTTEDFDSVKNCLKSGVTVIATAHATDLDDLNSKFGKEVKCFEKIIFLKDRGSVFKICRRCRGDY